MLCKFSVIPGPTPPGPGPDPGVTSVVLNFDDTTSSFLSEGNLKNITDNGIQFNMNVDKSVYPSGNQGGESFWGEGPMPGTLYIGSSADPDGTNPPLPVQVGASVSQNWNGTDTSEVSHSFKLTATVSNIDSDTVYVTISNEEI